MCNPKPGTRCPSHATAKLNALSEETTALLAQMLTETEEGGTAPASRAEEFTQLSEKLNHARTEYCIAMAASSRDEHQQDLRRYLEHGAQQEGLNDSQIEDYVSIHTDMYKGIAATRKRVAAEIEEEVSQHEDNGRYRDSDDSYLARSIEGNNILMKRNMSNMIRNINEGKDGARNKEIAVLLKTRINDMEAEVQRREANRTSAEGTSQTSSTNSSFEQYEDYTPDNYSQIVAEMMNEKFPNSRDTYSVIRGRRYDKIAARGPAGGGGRVFMFVERSTGAFLKPAGWRAPAAGVRYQPTSGPDAARIIQESADEYGSWLYANR